jgi:hypothetical protein
MNYRGSYRRLVANSKSAMVGAIEIYNKPRFDYRDEVFVLLLINAFELLLKAIVSKGNKSIFEKKKRNQPYRTINWRTAMTRAVSTAAWPTPIPYRAVEENLELLSVYRDNAVHFYNAPGFGVVIYSLAQTSIVNYRDILRAVFGQELADEINWQLMPLGVHPPVDPVAYLGGPRHGGKTSTAVDQYLKAIQQATKELEAEGVDTGRLLTLFDVTLQSTKKIEKADIVVGVGAAPTAAPVIVTRKMDPNVTHPYRQKDVLEKLATSHDGRITSWVFQALARHYDLRANDTMCWREDTVSLVKWSPEVVTFVKNLSAKDIERAKKAYADWFRQARGGRSGAA